MQRLKIFIPSTLNEFRHYFLIKLHRLLVTIKNLLKYLFYGNKFGINDPSNCEHRERNKGLKVIRHKTRQKSLRSGKNIKEFRVRFHRDTNSSIQEGIYIDRRWNRIHARRVSRSPFVQANP